MATPLKPLPPSAPFPASDINLVPESYRVRHWGLRRISSRIAVVAAAVLLALSGAALGGVLFLNASLQERVAQIDRDIGAIQERRNEAGERALFEREPRLQSAERLLDARRSWSVLLDTVESMVVTGVTASKIRSSVGQTEVVTVSFTLEGSRYADLARQLSAFHAHPAVAGVTFESFVLGEAGVITTQGSLELTADAFGESSPKTEPQENENPQAPSGAGSV